MGTAEAVDETAVLKQSEDRMKAHIICGTCYPEAARGECAMGTPALCGEKVLGIKPRPPYVRCRKCETAQGAHRVLHILGR